MPRTPRQKQSNTDEVNLHVVCGLPRSGSTLLCNLLAQNPAIQLSGTSPLSGALEMLRQALSASSEVVGMLAKDREDTELRIERAFRGFVQGWYSGSNIIIDKSRGINDWSIHHRLLRQVAPDSAIICTVRDPRAVLGSIEKRNSEYPILDQSPGLKKVLTQRAADFFDPAGLVGSAIVGVEDLLRRQPSRLVLVRYEDFVQDPQRVLDRIYDAIPGLPKHDHNTGNVDPVFRDFDALYRHKFPHDDACGKIEPRPETWQQFVSSDVARWILERYPFFCQKLGYF